MIEFHSFFAGRHHLGQHQLLINFINNPKKKQKKGTCKTKISIPENHSKHQCKHKNEPLRAPPALLPAGLPPAEGRAAGFPD